MASLSVRNLDEAIYEQLRMRSLRHRVSMEEETRQIIAQAVSAPEQLSEVFRACFGETNGVDLQLQQHPPHYPMDFTE